MHACLHLTTLLTGWLASGAFALAKDESYDRFIGDIGPLNSSDKASGVRTRLTATTPTVHLEKSQTVQITIRTTKDCFYLYEVPPSLVATQVIGPVVENVNVVATEIERWVSKDLPKMCASVRPVSVLDNCQIVISPFVMRNVNGGHTLGCAHRRQLITRCSARTIFVV